MAALVSSIVQRGLDWWQGGSPLPGRPPSPNPVINPWADGPRVVTTPGISGYTHVDDLSHHLEKSTMKVQPIARDGNCLFSAIGQIFGFDAATVRLDAVEYLRDHLDDEFLKGAVKNAIEDYNTHCNEELVMKTQSIGLMLEKEEITVERFSELLNEFEAECASKKIDSPEIYIKRLAEASFFGGAAEIYALACCYERSIVVYEERDGLYKPSLVCVSKEGEGPFCRLRYSGESAHYDLVVA